MVVFWDAMASTYITCNMNVEECLVFEWRLCKFGYIAVWICEQCQFGNHLDPLDCCGTMADGRFLRGHGLNLYHLQYECLELLSIWEPPLYTVVYPSCEMYVMPKLRYLLDPLDHCGTMADGRFLRGRGLNLYHLQYECLGILSIWVTSS